MKNILCLLLTLCLLSPAMIACQNDDLPDDTTDSTPASDSVSVSDSASETEELKPNLPDKTFDGADYSILTAAEQWSRWYVMDSEDIKGDVISQAVYDRNNAVEKQYDVVLDYIVFNGYGAGMNTVSTALQDAVGGSATYDLMVGIIGYSTPNVIRGYYADLSDPAYSYIDLEQPWWHRFVNDEIAVGDRYYMASGHYGLNAIGSAMAVFFNKEMHEDYGFEDLYGLVKNKQWTYDKMLRLADEAKRDLNNDGAYGADDILGIVSTNDYLVGGLYVGFDHRVTGVDEDGNRYLPAISQKAVDINEKIFHLMHSADYYKQGSDLPDGTTNIVAAYEGAFANGKTFFLVHGLNAAVNEHLRNMEDDYGILPMPMYDEDQDTYYANSVPEHVSIPAYVNDGEFSAFICEALAYESYKQITPAYFEMALQEKYSRDPDTKEMLDIVVAGLACDFTNLYFRVVGDTVNGIGKTENLASYDASSRPASETALQNFMKSIEALEQE